jgi:AcrR family transcriptional regulator
MSQPPATKQIGRPRSEESKAAILAATWELLKTTSLRDLSIASIARQSGVGKTTIYRWWPSKVAVVTVGVQADGCAVAIPESIIL